jgi:pimeloyl-ACP methyl ester carboxylesterase
VALIDAQVEDFQSHAYRSLCELPLDLNRVILWNYQGASPVSEAIALEDCGEVGYCPTEADLEQRETIASIEGTTEALTSFCLSQSDLNIIDKLHRIRSPLLVIWGEEDDVLNQRQLRLLLEHARITKKVLLPATGHAPHLEHPEQTARILLEFFKPSDRLTRKGSGNHDVQNTQR